MLARGARLAAAASLAAIEDEGLRDEAEEDIFPRPMCKRLYDLVGVVVGVVWREQTTSMKCRRVCFESR